MMAACVRHSGSTDTYIHDTWSCMRNMVSNNTWPYCASNEGFKITSLQTVLGQVHFKKFRYEWNE